jgi:hypothetical protein
LRIRNIRIKKSDVLGSLDLSTASGYLPASMENKIPISNGGSKHLKQAPPWKIAIPFVIFCVIIMLQYCFSRNPLALFAVVVAAVMGAVWTYGAWTVRRDERHLSHCREVPRPRAGEATVISKARLGGLLKPVGYLVATENELMWIPWRTGVNAGDKISLSAESSTVAVAAFNDIVHFRSLAGMFGGETITLFFDSGCRRIRLLDPEGLANLLALIPEREDRDNK